MATFLPPLKKKKQRGHWGTAYQQLVLIMEGGSLVASV